MADRELYPFDPDYVVPTAEVLQRWLQQFGLSTRIAAAISYRSGEPLDWAAARLDRMLDDKVLDETDIEVLAAVTGVSATFWRSFEHNYRVGVAAGKTVIR